VSKQSTANGIFGSYYFALRLLDWKSAAVRD